MHFCKARAMTTRKTRTNLKTPHLSTQRDDQCMPTVKRALPHLAQICSGLIAYLAGIEAALVALAALTVAFVFTRTEAGLSGRHKDTEIDLHSGRPDKGSIP